MSELNLLELEELNGGRTSAFVKAAGVVAGAAGVATLPAWGAFAVGVGVGALIVS